VALLAPVADEMRPSMVRAFPQAMIGISAQGFMRRLNVGQEVHYRAWERAPEMLPHSAAVFFSDEDVEGHTVPWLSHCGPVLVRTQGQDGCELVHCGKHRRIPGFPSDEIDPTGAGDVFAAAFMIKLHDTKDPVAAARYANCVSSFSVAGYSTTTLPTAQQVDERLKTWTPS
jgi:sugar/nucleoside kinase (ribokinase family)